MDGIILINKEKDYTSRDVVNIIGKYLNTKKVGHSGTLDPLATGVLVIAINKGLKVINLLTNLEKEYIVDVKFGIETDTLDITGNILNEDNNYSVTKEQLINVLNKFKTTYQQEVPKYSAIKVNGKRLYEYARNNEEVTLPKKEVTIKEIELLEFNNNSFKFKTLVSKGTYIRSLIRDIGKELNILMTMSNLKRTKQGMFNIIDCNTLDDIKNNKFKVLSLKDVLSTYKMIEVTDELYNKIKNGTILENNYDEDIIIFIKGKDVIAIYKRYDKDKNKIKPLHVLI